MACVDVLRPERAGCVQGRESSMRWGRGRGGVRWGGLLEDAGEMSGGEASGAFILRAGDPCTILRAGM